MRFLILVMSMLITTVSVAKSRIKPSFFTIWADEYDKKLNEKEKLNKALTKCVDQSRIYVKERLGESREYVDYVISRVEVKQQYDSWEKKKPNGKFIYGSKVECEFTVKLLTKSNKHNF